MSKNPGYKTQGSLPKPGIHPALAFSTSSAGFLTRSAEAPELERKAAEKLAMEYGYPYNGCGCNKEKRPPLKRGQLKLQIARTLLSSLVAPGAKNRERGFGR
ncbi:hypothetical protein BAE44_0013988 [Dichanthelium oligosanthes]|uniref:Uncharacterized protein n=1 Tax=Dichanthelium oligosanthes TaxID=888268 RepID=A0A1E5VIM5_9POAL|nr:hypothetical protein BAE44_0013988 [Dichanthelium oligosanthes]